MTEILIDQDIYKALCELVGDDFIDEMVDAFLEEGAQFVEDLRTACADQDVDRFRRAAHSLKSNAATFGAMNLSILAKELEELARGNNLSEAAKKLEPIFLAFEKVRLALLEIKNG